jgi:sigma-B regulation protein RsbU (phosphoserine phosphatase)
MLKDSPASRNQVLRQVNLIRYALPIILFLIVSFYETWEHWLLEGRIGYDFHLTSEILFFGILGPFAVFLVLSYVASLLVKQNEAAIELEALNEGLELVVAERTEALEVRNSELAQANAELQKLDQLKSDFVSLVSHELRGPLTTLTGGLELALQDRWQMSSEARRFLEVMACESERLTKFVQTILDVSKLEAGKLSMNRGPVAVLPLLQQVVVTLFPNGKRSIKWNVSSSIPPVWADETYLEKVLCNLFSNADKYSSPGTPIEVSTHLADGFLDITITDFGPGIPAEMHNQIFKRFQRIERSDEINTEGWGLGLYFAKYLTEAQGGQLTVQSPVTDEESPGAAFTLTLPITRDVPEDA